MLPTWLSLFQCLITNYEAKICIHSLHQQAILHVPGHTLSHHISRTRNWIAGHSCGHSSCLGVLTTCAHSPHCHQNYLVPYPNKPWTWKSHHLPKHTCPPHFDHSDQSISLFQGTCWWLHSAQLDLIWWQDRLHLPCICRVHSTTRGCNRRRPTSFLGAWGMPLLAPVTKGLVSLWSHLDVQKVGKSIRLISKFCVAAGLFTPCLLNQNKNNYICQHDIYDIHTSYAYRVDQTQSLVSCCMLSELSLMPQGVAVMLCQVQWRTFFRCNKTNYACLPI